MSHARKKGVTISKQIVIGTYSFEDFDEPKKRTHDSTSDYHMWYCGVRSPTGEDLSYWIKAVEFTLHESFTNRDRILTKPPFFVEERGWGEFDVKVKLVFQDPLEKEVVIYHKLALLPSSGVISPPSDQRGRCVRNEVLDTIVFHEPREWFYEALVAGPVQTAWERRDEPIVTATVPITPISGGSIGSSNGNYTFLRPHFGAFPPDRENAVLQEVLSAVAFVQGEVSMLRRELVALELQGVQLANSSSSAGGMHQQQHHAPPSL